MLDYRSDIRDDAQTGETGVMSGLIEGTKVATAIGSRRMNHASPGEVFVMQFDEDEIVFTSTGALCVCAAAGDMIQRLYSAQETIAYRLLSDETDSPLIDEIRYEIAAAAMAGDTRVAPQPYADSRVA